MHQKQQQIRHSSHVEPKPLTNAEPATLASFSELPEQALAAQMRSIRKHAYLAHHLRLQLSTCKVGLVWLP